MNRRLSTVTAALALVVTVPAAAPAVSSLAGPGTNEPASPIAIGKDEAVGEPKTGLGYLRLPGPIRLSFGAGRRTKLLVHPGERVRRGQLLARTERPGLRRRLHSAERALANARARLDRAKRRATERNRSAQLSAARASALRTAQDALDATRARAETRGASSEQAIARARQAAAEAQRSAKASAQSLRAADDQAQRSLEQARTAATADRAELDRRVARAQAELARAQEAARSSGDQLEAAVAEAEQTLAAAKNSQAENAQGYQSAVDQAQARVAEAESTLSTDQDKRSAAHSDRDRLKDEVGSRAEKVDELHARVKADKEALAACANDPPSGGCGASRSSYDEDAANLDGEKARLAQAESNLAEVESTLSSLAQTEEDDRAAVAAAQSGLADAQQAQSSGQAEDSQRVQSAEDALANAQTGAASGASASRSSVSQAQRSLDSASTTRTSRLSHDQQAVAHARSSADSAQGRRASGVSSGERAERSAQQALASAQAIGNAAVARTDQEIAAAAAAFRDAQQSLSATLASSSARTAAPTPSDLAVAETKVELATLAVRSARDRLAESSELRAPASGTVAAVPGSDQSAGSISLTDLGAPQVTVSVAAGEAAGMRVGEPATVTVSASPEKRLAAHVLSVGPARPAADGTSRREVTFALDEDDPSVEPGMTAHAEVAPEQDETAARVERLRRLLAAQQDIARRQDTGVVAIATRYLGVPYVWGGDSPQTGFDCSGLVKYVYAQRGISLPHYAASQFNYGIPVLRDQLEPGDLVFFHALGHVGIYIGNDEFIHAPHTGDVVKISSLNEFSYASTFVGARRLETAAAL
jgi:cell wall-associated NlpC family hydrolase